MDEQTLALKLYEISHSQFIARIKQRDSILLFYVASIGTISGLVFGKVPVEVPVNLLIVIPFLTFACGVMMAYHTFFIEALHKYPAKYLASHLSLIVFEVSPSFSSLGVIGIILRTVGYTCILAIPSGLALSETFSVIDIPKSHWYLALITCILGTLAVLGADVFHIHCVQHRAQQAQRRLVEPKRYRHS